MMRLGMGSAIWLRLLLWMRLTPNFRHARPCAGHLRLSLRAWEAQTWMAGTSPAMTGEWL